MTTTLIPTWTLGSLDLTASPFAVEFGGDHGAPETVSELVTSMLADGDLARRTREGNREISIVVIVEGASLGELAENEALLRAECTKVANTLTFNPGDFDSPASVFEVQVAQMRHAREEQHEAHLLRRWELTLTCAPFARSANPVTVQALDQDAGTDLVVDTCDSATGWTATHNGAPTPVSTTWQAGAVAAVEVVAPGPQTLTLTRTGSISFATRRYLVIEAGFNASFGAVPVKVISPEGAEIPKVSQHLISPGWYRCVYDTGGVTLSAFTVSAYLPGDYAELMVREVSLSGKSSVMPRQRSRILRTVGTERTPASIHVEPTDGSAWLTECIVHTCPEDGSGYSPPLRRWRTSGPTVNVDASTLSGAFEVITSAGVTYDTPTSALPEGGYLLAAYMRRAAAGTIPIAWSTSTVFPCGTIEEGFTNGTETVTFSDTDWHLVPLATLTLPSVRTKSGTVRTIIQGLGSGSTLYLDEAWLFRMGDDCALTAVSTLYPHLWLDSPDLNSPVPTVWVGDETSVRVHPGEGLQAMGMHVLHPQGTSVFTAALVDNPAVDATFYPRWHSNAAI